MVNRGRTGPPGHTAGHAVEPAADLLGLADRPGFSGEDKKRRLEGILRILFVAEQPPAQAEDHSPVALHEHGERQPVPTSGELLDQSRVGGRPKIQMARIGIHSNSQMP